MTFPTEIIIDHGRLIDVILMVVLIATVVGLVLWVLLSISLEKWSKMNKRKKSTVNLNHIPSKTIVSIPSKTIVSITTLILMAFLIFHAKENFNIGKSVVDLEHEESSLRLLEGEIEVSDSFNIENDKLFYRFKDSNLILPRNRKLGTIKIENKTATMTPTSLLGIAFMRYGDYVQNNPNITPEQSFHKIDVENEEIELIIYDDNFETYEKLTFDAN